MFLYRLFIHLYGLAIRLGAAFHPKAKAWVEGRRHWRQQLQSRPRGEGPLIWMHCASLGEFEQGRPVLEALHREVENVQLVLTFFSPSGYEMRKDYPLADGVFYLPLDTPGNVRDFLDLLQPDAAVFVKYEFWYEILAGLRRRKVPTYLISAVFRPGQVFFRPWGRLFRRMLSFFTGIFVQDEDSRQLLASIGIERVSVAGDTRIDRVLAIAEETGEWPELEQFGKGSQVLVAGSTWGPEEQILTAWLAHPSSKGWKCIVAPHEIREEHLQRLEAQWGPEALRFTRLSGDLPGEVRILILDTIGMLARAYHYGDAAFIGGGFGKGIHNILEPMAHGLPVLFGPKHRKFREAGLLIEAGAAWAVQNEAEFFTRMESLSNTDARKTASEKGLAVLNAHLGATKKILLNFTPYAHWS